MKLRSKEKVVEFSSYLRMAKRAARFVPDKKDESKRAGLKRLLLKVERGNNPTSLQYCVCWGDQKRENVPCLIHTSSF